MMNLFYQLAFIEIDPKMQEKLIEKFWVYSESVLGALVTLIIGLIAMQLLGSLFRKVLGKSSKVDQQVVNLSVKVLKILILVFTVVMIMARFGVETTSIIAVIGGLGLAVGLALQGMLSNVASGVMLLCLRPLKIGELVSVGGEVYVIDDVGLFVTEAHLLDGPKVWLPNNTLWGTTITNLSRMHDDLRRINEVIGIAYGDDINKAFELIEAALATDERFLKEPEHVIKVDSLGDNSVNIRVIVYVNPDDWLIGRMDMLKIIKEALDEGGITIPFPQQDVWMHQVAS